ncbi:MAG TPA: peroxiredoxin [Chryseobacterium sp.]|nr:peroxiredoxin [Chryseobacterium sp.]
MLNPGTVAPDFELYATPDQKLKLSELKGKKVVLVFYPADWSPVCSDELTIYNEAAKLFEKYNAQVVGISVDSKWSHTAFSEQHYYHFPLLADFEPKGKVARLYESYDAENGLCKRSIYLIDEEGKIVWNYLSPVGVNPGIDGVLDALDQLKNDKK